MRLLTKFNEFAKQRTIFVHKRTASCFKRKSLFSSKQFTEQVILLWKWEYVLLIFHQVYHFHVFWYNLWLILVTFVASFPILVELSLRYYCSKMTIIRAVLYILGCQGVGNVKMKTKSLLVGGRTVVEWWSKIPIFRIRPPGVSACKRALYCWMVGELSKKSKIRVCAHACVYIMS